jgi:hypothetical protein
MKKSPASGAKFAERMVGNLAFFLLFPGFFFYHTLLGTGTTGAFLAGYFTPISLLFVVPLCFLYGCRIKRDPQWLARTDVYFALYLAYFAMLVIINAVAGATLAIVINHGVGVLFLINTFLIFRFIDFAHPEFRIVAIISMLAMSAIVFTFSVDGVFYLGSLGISKDPDSLATYQGFSRSYHFTFLAVIAFTRMIGVRVFLYILGAATLFVNSARSEFAALLFAIPIIEFYYAKHKLLLIGALAIIVTLLYMNLDQIQVNLPNNRVLELLDLSHSSSANKRHHLTVRAMQTIATHPLIGDYGSYAPGFYSHNILSAWVDLGLFGIAFLLAILIVPAIPMFIREFISGRKSGTFMLGFCLACTTLLLLLTSHYFTDMLIAATLGAYSTYSYRERYAKRRPPDLSACAPRYAHLLQTMPQPGTARLSGDAGGGR